MAYDYEWFKIRFRDLTDIDLSSYKERQMKRRIDAFIKKYNYRDYNEFFIGLKANKSLYNEFISYITINVSEFYRNPEQWDHLGSEILPMLLEKSKILKVWSAACSTGDEPYSLVLMLSKFMPLDNIKVIATDIDKAILEKAKEGVYPAKSLDNLPHEFKLKYFTPILDGFKINDEIKACIEFRRHDLLKNEYPLNCDLIVCRNVLIYLTEEAKDNIHSKFNKSLKIGGVLFIGGTEQIISSASYNFKAIKTYFYQRLG